MVNAVNNNIKYFLIFFVLLGSIYGFSSQILYRSSGFGEENLISFVDIPNDANILAFKQAIANKFNLSREKLTVLAEGKSVGDDMPASVLTRAATVWVSLSPDARPVSSSSSSSPPSQPLAPKLTPIIDNNPLEAGHLEFKLVDHRTRFMDSQGIQTVKDFKQRIAARFQVPIENITVLQYSKIIEDNLSLKNTSGAGALIVLLPQAPPLTIFSAPVLDNGPPQMGILKFYTIGFTKNESYSMNPQGIKNVGDFKQYLAIWLRVSPEKIAVFGQGAGALDDGITIKQLLEYKRINVSLKT